MKILTAEQIRAWDRATIEREGISSVDLMERASLAICNWITSRFAGDTPMIVLCGTGNNGGDGLALTRLLLERGYGVRAFVVKHTSGYAPDCGANLERLQRQAPDAVTVLEEGAFITELPQEIVVIDAIFGTGINRPLDGYVADFIRHINATGNRIIASLHRNRYEPGCRGAIHRARGLETNAAKNPGANERANAQPIDRTPGDTVSWPCSQDSMSAQCYGQTFSSSILGIAMSLHPQCFVPALQALPWIAEIASPILSFTMQRAPEVWQSSIFLETSPSS